MDRIALQDKSSRLFYEGDPAHEWQLGHIGVLHTDGIVYPYCGELLADDAVRICVAHIAKLPDFKSINAVKLSDVGIL